MHPCLITSSALACSIVWLFKHHLLKNMLLSGNWVVIDVNVTSLILIILEHFSKSLPKSYYSHSNVYLV